MVTVRVVLLVLLGVSAGAVRGVRFSCETEKQGPTFAVDRECLLTGVVLLSAEDVSNATFPTEDRFRSVRLVDGQVPDFIQALAQKFASARDLTVDVMGLRRLFIQPGWEHLSAQNNSVWEVAFATDGPDQHQLRTLYLHNNALTGVPAFGRRFPQLKVLALDGNLLESVSLDAFATLPSLQSLSIARNRLIDVSPASVQLLKLTHLSLAGNRLLTLKVSGWEMESLVSLDLSANDLYLLDVPKVPGQLRALQELRYEENEWHCGWLSALQLNLRGGKVRGGGRDPDGRCAREQMVQLEGICCHESVAQDFPTDPELDRGWEALEELQRRYELVRFAFDLVEYGNARAQRRRVYAVREELTGPVAAGQDVLEGDLRRLAATVAEDAARLERLETSIGRTVADVRRSVDELHELWARPRPTLDAVVQESIAKSIGQVSDGIEKVRRLTHDYVYELDAYDKRLAQLDKHVVRLEGLLADLRKQNQALQEQVEDVEPDVKAAFDLLESENKRPNPKYERFWRGYTNL